MPATAFNCGVIVFDTLSPKPGFHRYDEGQALIAGSAGLVSHPFRSNGNEHP